MAYVVVKKATLLMPSGPDPDGHHLHIITTAPCDQNQVLLTTLCSVKEGRVHDKACLVEAGEHEFAKKLSFIEYRLSSLLHCDKIAKFVDGWYFTPKTEVSDELFERIRAGILTSDFTPRFIQTYFGKNAHL